MKDVLSLAGDKSQRCLVTSRQPPVGAGEHSVQRVQGMAGCRLHGGCQTQPPAWVRAPRDPILLRRHRAQLGAAVPFPGVLGRGEDTRTGIGREVMLRRGAASTWDVDTSKGSEMEAIYKCL